MYVYLFDNHCNTIVGVLNSILDAAYIESYKKKENYILMKPESVFNVNADDEKKIYELLAKAGKYPEFCKVDGTLQMYISGDWKHDHIFINHLMESLGYTCIAERDSMSDGSDYYYSRHVYLKNI